MGTRGFEGCIEVRVIQDTADPAHLFAIEEWEPLEHDQAYRRWRAGEGATGLKELLAEPPGLSPCDPLNDP